MPSPSGGIVRASIKNVDTNEVIDCMFRPKEYTFTKANRWEKERRMGSNIPELSFSGGDGMKLTMELFFDGYEAGLDVRTYTDRVWNLMMVSPNTEEEGDRGRPPQCEFHWGYSLSFRAVITEIRQTFTLFLPDGTPVRSTMNVTFQQSAEEGRFPGQNPTTVSRPGYKTRRVQEGETLDWIAYDEYGDSARWRELADINGLDNPMILEPGQLLAIAPKN
jgi:hypothetical protein